MTIQATGPRKPVACQCLRELSGLPFIRKATTCGPHLSDTPALREPDGRLATVPENAFLQRKSAAMLKELHLRQVGPCRVLDAAFKPRLNLITGDNGLGKSFLLDIAWWALTRRWPRDLNKALVSGYVARPEPAREGSIEFVVEGKTKRDLRYRSSFSPQDEAWTGKAGRPHNPGLVLYAMADGGFALWDPARNYWRKEGNVDVQDRVPAYVFGPRDVWDGLADPQRGQLCKGLLNDWADWQRENGKPFQLLCSVLAALSPGPADLLRPGPLTRISLDDVRDMPTLQSSYGKPVPVLHASSGLRRVVALAYLLVWSWQEHLKASALIEQDTTPQVVFLIDEIEAHLHPRWQRSIVSSLLDVTLAMAPEANVQLIVATHSPLVMASAEPRFDAEQDAWFDLDLVPGTGTGTGNSDARVAFVQRPFERLGDASRWLVSDAFDLQTARSREAEQALDEAEALLDKPTTTATQANALTQKLAGVLGETDPFWARWRVAGASRGWWARSMTTPAAAPATGPAKRQPRRPA